MAIEGPDEFKVRLHQLPRQTCILIAARSALRALPLVTCQRDITDVQKSIALLTLRAIITSICAAFRHNAAIEVAARAADNAHAGLGAAYAARATYKTARNALRAADAVARSVFKIDAAAAANVAFLSSSSAYSNSPYYNTVRNAAYVDADTTKLQATGYPLWHEAGEPIWLSNMLKNSENLLDSGPDWGFWRDWYHGFLDGNPLDWELQRRVALIPDPVWEAGPVAVAKAIEKIRDEMNGLPPFERPESVPEIEKKTLVQHVRKLLENPDISELAATGTAEAIERVIADYKRDAPANCLPEELEHLEALPDLYRAIAESFASSESVQTKEADLVAQITALNAKVAQLEADLKAAREKTLNGRFKVKAIESLGSTFGSAWFLVLWDWEPVTSLVSHRAMSPTKTCVAISAIY